MFTTQEAVELAWLLILVLHSLDLRNARFSVPIMIPCNLSRVAKAIVACLRLGVCESCQARGVSGEDTRAIINRIKLINQEQTQVRPLVAVPV